MNDFLPYLFDLSRAQPRDSRYQAFVDAIKAFDSGIVPVFVFTDEDMEHSRQHGDMPDGAEPVSLTLRFAPLSSRTGGQLGPPWYIASKLREVADQLEQAGVQEFERWLEHDRLEGTGIARLERTLPDAERRLEAIQGMMQDYDKLQALQADSEAYAAGIEAIVRLCLDLGVNLPTCETPAEYEDMVRRLPELIHDEIQRTEARIRRTREQLVEAGQDVDGFAGDDGPTPDGEADEPPLIY